MYWKNKIENFYHDIKWSIINFFKYFRIVSKMRPWDYKYILMMMKFQIKDLCGGIEKYAHEIDADRLPRIEKMKRAIELLNNNIEDNYADRCGFEGDAFEIIWDDINDVKDNGNSELKMVKNPGFEDYDEDDVLKRSYKMKENEWNELFNILKDNMQGWWD